MSFIIPRQILLCRKGRVHDVEMVQEADVVFPLNLPSTKCMERVEDEWVGPSSVQNTPVVQHGEGIGTACVMVVVFSTKMDAVRTYSQPLVAPQWDADSEGGFDDVSGFHRVCECLPRQTGVLQILGPANDPDERPVREGQTIKVYFEASVTVNDGNLSMKNWITASLGTVPPPGSPSPMCNT